jgi:hypothetical protein
MKTSVAIKHAVEKIRLQQGIRSIGVIIVDETGMTHSGLAVAREDWGVAKQLLLTQAEDIAKLVKLENYERAQRAAAIKREKTIRRKVKP